jgi:hypothetical protein
LPDTCTHKDIREARINEDPCSGSCWMFLAFLVCVVRFAAKNSFQNPEKGHEEKSMPWRRMGLALLEEDAVRLDALAEKYELTRNALLRFAVVYFLQHIEQGEIMIQDFIRIEKKLIRPDEDRN